MLDRKFDQDIATAQNPTHVVEIVKGKAQKQEHVELPLVCERILCLTTSFVVLRLTLRLRGRESESKEIQREIGIFNFRMLILYNIYKF